MSRVEAVPDNVEFSVATANTEVTINVQNNSSLTSANDTATQKYTDSNKTRHRYVVGADKAILITKYNGVALTDPRTVVAGLTFGETDIENLVSITIKTQQDTTAVHCFVR